jgi:preprotein translocase subunit SecA
MEDDLMRIFGSDRMKGMMERLGVPEDEAIENRVLSKAIEAAQRKVEGHNFDIRKHLLEYDDVLNKHRTVIYKKRRELLQLSHERTTEGERPLKQKVLEMMEGELEAVVAFHTAAEHPDDWDRDAIREAVKAILPPDADVTRVSLESEKSASREDVIEWRTKTVESLMALVREAYHALEERVGDAVMLAEVEKAVMLRTIDDLWIEHLEAMDHLRHGIGLQGYGQRDPLVVYKQEAYRMFNDLVAAINQRVARMIFKIQIATETAEQELHRLAPMARPVQLSAPAKEAGDEHASRIGSRAPGQKMEKVGRNDPCPCGSGKKYKKCHGG